MADPWAAFNPVGGHPVKPAGQPAAPISGADDPWAAFNPISQSHPEQQPATGGPSNWPMNEDPRSYTDQLLGRGGPRKQLWPERLARSIGHSIYSGATLPGDVAQGKVAVDPSNPEFMGRTLDLAGISTPMAPRTAQSLNPARAPSREVLDASADAGYDAVRTSGVEYTPQSVATSADKLAYNLNARGRSDRRAPETHQIVNELANPPAGAVSVTIDGISRAREELTLIAADHTKSAGERAAAEIAKRHLDDFMANVQPGDVLAGDAAQAAKSLKNAQKDYAAARRSETITDLNQSAERQAARANSGMNADHRRRAKIGGILDSEKKSYGWSPDELARIEDINNGTRLGNTLRNGGNLLGGGGGMLAAGYGLTGAFYNPYIAALPIAGALMKKGGDYFTRRAIEKLDEATRLRSATGDAMAAGPSMMPPAEQLRQTAIAKALMEGALPAPGQQIPSPSDQVMARFLMGGR